MGSGLSSPAARTMSLGALIPCLSTAPALPFIPVPLPRTRDVRRNQPPAVVPTFLTHHSLSRGADLRFEPFSPVLEGPFHQPGSLLTPRIHHLIRDPSHPPCPDRTGSPQSQHGVEPTRWQQPREPRFSCPGPPHCQRLASGATPSVGIRRAPGSVLRAPSGPCSGGRGHCGAVQSRQRQSIGNGDPQDPLPPRCLSAPPKPLFPPASR